MNREPANKSLGFFGMYKESFKITFSRKKIFSQITLAILLPLTIIFLSQIQVSHIIRNRNNAKSRGIASAITEIIYAILNLIFTLLSTSSVVYLVACIYTTRDITFKGVIGIFPKVWGKLIVTFLWCLLIVLIYTGVAVGLFLWFFLSVNDEGQGGNKVLIFGLCLFIPFFIGLIYMENVWSVAIVMSVLENDCGRKALGKSMKLIRGKIFASSAAFLVLHIASAGVIFAFSWLVVYGDILSLVGKIFVGIACYLVLVVYGDILSLVGKIFVGIACYLVLMVLIHFTLVIQTIVYFVCKSYHNEDVLNVAKHLDVGYANLGSQRDDIQMQRASV